MVDQVSSLQSWGVPAAILRGNNGVDKKLFATEGEFTEGMYRLLYSAPVAVHSRLSQLDQASCYSLLLSSQLWLPLRWMRHTVCTNGKKYLYNCEAYIVFQLCRSSGFRPSYGCLSELRAFAPPGAPTCWQLQPLSQME